MIKSTITFVNDLFKGESDSDRIFNIDLLKVSFIYWAICVVSSTLIATTLHGELPYQMILVFASGPLVAPAIVISTQLVRRCSKEHLHVWQGWLHGLKLFFLWGFIIASIAISNWLMLNRPLWSWIWIALRVFGPLYAILTVGLWGWSVKASLKLAPSIWQRAELVTNVAMALVVTFIPVSTIFGPAAFSTWRLIIPIAKLISAMAGIGAIIVWSGAVMDLLKIKSGKRAVSVDGLDVIMAIVVLAGPALLLIHPYLSKNSSSYWLLIPILTMAILLPGVAGACIMTFARLPRGDRNIVIALLGLLATASIQAWLQILEILNHYAFPIWPFICAECVNFGFFMIVPLSEMKSTSKGLDRLATRAQLRSWNLMPVILCGGLVSLLYITWKVHQSITWAPGFTAAILVSLIALASVRHIFIVVETRSLYRELEGLARELYAQSRSDPLTGLDNRRSLSESLVKLIAQSKRAKTTFCLVMLDLDHFKGYNDSFGHIAGDRLLQLFGMTLRSSIREQDFAARFGGEEFCLLLPNTQASGAEKLTSTLRRSVFTEKALQKSVTFSAGIAQWISGEGPDELIKRADKALYQAKDEGRNRVCISS